MSISDFYTSDEAEAGIKIPLSDKFGSPTDSWIKIRGVDSQHFRDAKLDVDRSSLSLISEKDDKKRREELNRLNRELIAALVLDWSEDFHEQIGKPTKSNIIGFFEKAPQIVDEIDRTAGSRRVFFSMFRKNSSNGSESKPS